LTGGIGGDFFKQVGGGGRPDLSYELAGSGGGKELAKQAPTITKGRDGPV